MPLHKTSGRWQLGLILSLVTVFLWGILAIALAIIIKTLDVYTIIWFRFLIAFLVLGSYLFSKNQLPQLKQFNPKNLQLLAIAAVFLALNYAFFMLGLKLTTPANAQVLVQLAGVFMGLGGLVIFKEHYSRQQWLGLGILTCGFSLFFNQQLQGLITAQGQYLLGSGIIVLASVVWAVYALAQKQLLQKFSSANIMWIIYGVCALLFTPFASPAHLLNLSAFQWGILIFCALNTVFGYGSFAEALEHWEASRVSAVLSLTPLVTLASVLIVSLLAPGILPPHNITILSTLGAVFVVAGSTTIALGKN